MTPEHREVLTKVYENYDSIKDFIQVMARDERETTLQVIEHGLGNLHNFFEKDGKFESHYKNQNFQEYDCLKGCLVGSFILEKSKIVGVRKGWLDKIFEQTKLDSFSSWDVIDIGVAVIEMIDDAFYQITNQILDEPELRNSPEYVSLEHAGREFLIERLQEALV